MTRYLLGERPHLSEGVQEEGGRLDLLLDAGRYALEVDREHPGVLAVVQLDRGCLDLRMHDGLGRTRRRLEALDLDGYRPRRLGSRVQPEVGGRDDPEGSQGPREQLGEVVAGDVLDDLAARLRHRPVVQDDGYADDQVADSPVPEPARSRGVRRDDAPYGSSPFRRIYGEHLVRAGEMSLQVLELHPGLDAYHLVAGDVLDDLVHARGANDEVERRGRVAEVQLGPATARRDHEPLAARELHQLARLLDGARLDDEGGLHALHGI